MAKDITKDITTRKYQQTEIPQDILDTFFDYLETKDEDVKLSYDIDTLGQEVLTRKVVTRTHRSLTEGLKLFEKIYPQYFDKTTILKVKELEKKTGESEENNILDDVRKAFEGGLK